MMRDLFLSFFITVAIVVIIILGLFVFLENRTGSDLAELLPADGTPVLILQSKVGDDTVPHIHQTFCQILPYKRFIQDDQIFCYVEVITDWEVERY